MGATNDGKYCKDSEYFLRGQCNVSRYLQEIRNFPMLAPDEEFMLAKGGKEHQDTEAAHRLVTSQLRLVAKIAMGYRGYGLPLSELISPVVEQDLLSCIDRVRARSPDKRI
jgi:DNA-directed RNA polymerase sigma subunit (sigma70/sigma32)